MILNLFSKTRYLLLAIGMLFFSACSVLSPVQPKEPTKYMLSRTPACVPVKRTHHKIMLVSVPETRPVYNTNQMAYTLRPYQMAYFSRNEWAETPTQMLHPLLVQTLQNTHYFQAVMVPPYTGRYEYMLNTQLLEFKEDYTQRVPVFVMKVNAQLYKIATNQIYAARQFTTTIVMPQNSPYGGVYAANAATANILEQISIFCLKNTR